MFDSGFWTLLLATGDAAFAVDFEVVLAVQSPFS